VGIFDEIDCFIVLFSNGGLPKVAFEIKPPTGEPPQASPMGVLDQPGGTKAIAAHQIKDFRPPNLNFDIEDEDNLWFRTRSV
jgi:hypothetical protein